MRTIDGALRRRHLAEAVWRITRREGLGGVSVRAVATEASLSTGSVRHFFASQDDLYVFAMDSLVEDVSRDVRRALDQHWPPVELDEPDEVAQQGRAAVTAVLEELLPLTPQHEAQFQAQFQFITMARVTPVLQATSDRLARETRTLVRHLVQSLVDLGAARADLDIDLAATQLGVLLDGITLQMVTSPGSVSPQMARALVTQCLEGWEPRK